MHIKTDYSAYFIHTKAIENRDIKAGKRIRKSNSTVSGSVLLFNYTGLKGDHLDRKCTQNLTVYIKLPFSSDIHQPLQGLHVYIYLCISVSEIIPKK